MGRDPSRSGGKGYFPDRIAVHDRSLSGQRAGGEIKLSQPLAIQSQDGGEGSLSRFVFLVGRNACQRTEVVTCRKSIFR
jgi:hypothetical protein